MMCDVIKLSWRLPALLFALVSIIPATVPAASAHTGSLSGHSYQKSQCTVVYFDLGDVLVDTSDPAHLRYEEGALDYVRQLRGLGVKVGLISNIPPSWGTNDTERLIRLQSFIAETWSEPKPFVWSYFEGRVWLPRSDEELKPAPALFQRAHDAAGRCTAYFQGENPAEVEAATAVGLRAYLVGAPDQPFFMPLWKLWHWR